MYTPEHWLERIDRLNINGWHNDAGQRTPMFASTYDLPWPHWHDFLATWYVYHNARFGESLYHNPRLESE